MSKFKTAVEIYDEVKKAPACSENTADITLKEYISKEEHKQIVDRIDFISLNELYYKLFDKISKNREDIYYIRAEVFDEILKIIKQELERD
jgi:hypothetical protein